MLNRRTFLAGTIGSFLPSSGMQGPILSPDKPWEGSCAMPFGGGIYQSGASWRCYYLANFNRICLALSDDGLTWIKPDLGIIPGTNILLELPTMDGFSVVPHLGRWYMIVSQRGGGPLRLLDSRNGLWWSDAAVMPWAGDRTTLWWNPVKARWTFNVRVGEGTVSDPRRIDRVESETFIPKTWQPIPWLWAEVADAGSEAAYATGNTQLYAVDVVPESDRLVGLFTIWRGQEAGRPKLNDVSLAFSKEGDEWVRQRTPILTLGAKGSWHFGNVQGVTHGVHRVNGRYRLYASGRAGDGQGGNGVCAMGYRDVARL